MLTRTKPRKCIEIKRTIRRTYKLTDKRRELIKHVLIYFPHWVNEVSYLDDWFLLMHVHPMDRQYFKRLFHERKLPNDYY